MWWTLLSGRGCLASAASGLRRQARVSLCTSQRLAARATARGCEEYLHSWARFQDAAIHVLWQEKTDAMLAQAYRRILYRSLRYTVNLFLGSGSPAGAIATHFG